jgi:hypothetical protein
MPRSALSQCMLQLEGKHWEDDLPASGRVNSRSLLTKASVQRIRRYPAPWPRILYLKGGILLLSTSAPDHCGLFHRSEATR